MKAALVVRPAQFSTTTLKESPRMEFWATNSSDAKNGSPRSSELWNVGAPGSAEGPVLRHENVTPDALKPLLPDASNKTGVGPSIAVTSSDEDVRPGAKTGVCRPLAGVQILVAIELLVVPQQLVTASLREYP